MYVIGHDGTEYTCSVGDGDRVNAFAIKTAYEWYRNELQDKYYNMFINGSSQEATWKEHSNEIIEKIAQKIQLEIHKKTSQINAFGREKCHLLMVRMVKNVTRNIWKWWMNLLKV